MFVGTIFCAYIKVLLESSLKKKFSHTISRRRDREPGGRVRPAAVPARPGPLSGGDVRQPAAALLPLRVLRSDRGRPSRERPSHLQVTRARAVLESHGKKN